MSFPEHQNSMSFEGVHKVFDPVSPRHGAETGSNEGWDWFVVPCKIPIGAPPSDWERNNVRIGLGLFVTQVFTATAYNSEPSMPGTSPS